jgi:hypothetical protein
MDTVIRPTVTTNNNSDVINTTKNIENKNTSLYSYNKDPDLLIKQYFLYSSEQRAKIRENIAINIKSLPSLIEVLKWGASNKAHDAYDGAVDLLAEINNIKLFNNGCKYLGATNQLWLASNRNMIFFALDSLWEILIKSIAYSYKIPSEERLRLLNNLVLIPPTNRRIFKAALIDAFVSLSDQYNNSYIKNIIQRFTSLDEKDQYIRSYAEEALEEL